jgi:3-oxoacyl-[acyl-carrier protein] reductase
MTDQRQRAIGTALVFGAQEVIGQVVVDALSALGTHVLACDSVGLTASFVDQKDPRAVKHDLRGPIEKLFERCEDVVGPIEALICVPPPVEQILVADMPPEMLRRVVEDELVVPALLMAGAARRMSARRFGRIVTFCSMSAKTGVHTRVAPFAAAKGGLLAYVRVMAAEYAKTGVTVNAVATALFEPQVERLPPEERAELAKGVPVGRFGRPAEAAAAALYLCSDDAGFVTGETLNLSGGRFMD